MGLMTEIWSEICYRWKSWLVRREARGREGQIDVWEESYADDGCEDDD